jgi:hypothetical protein
MNRRTWLKAAAAAAPLAGAARLGAIDYGKPVPEAEGLTALSSGGLVFVRWNIMPLCCYRAQSGQKLPDFWPLAGPVTGLSLVGESLLPYPHHRGLWLGCQPLNEGDYWADGSLDQGQIRPLALNVDVSKAAQRIVTITNRCEWVRKNAPSPFEDERRFTIRVQSERLWLMDAALNITARENVTIKSAKHSFFAMRSAADVCPLYGGVLMNSEGATGAEGTYGKPARWCGYHGKRAQRRDNVEGIAIMNHPGNPWQPCPWFTRDYGHLSPSPFNFLKKPWTLEKGQSIALRYRIALHAGDPKEAGLDGVYREWANA